MAGFLQKLIVSLIEKLIAFVVDQVRIKVAENQLRKKVKAQIKEIKKDPSRKRRAQRINDILSVLVIMFLFSACGAKWEWKPDAYAADHKFQSLFNAQEKEVLCSEPAFDDFICFPSDNIVELKVNIERMKKRISKLRISKKYKRQILEGIDLTLARL